MRVSKTSLEYALTILDCVQYTTSFNQLLKKAGCNFEEYQASLDKLKKEVKEEQTQNIISKVERSFNDSLDQLDFVKAREIVNDLRNKIGVHPTLGSWESEIGCVEALLESALECDEKDLFGE